MKVEQINELAHEVYLQRLLIQQAKDRHEKLLADNFDIQENLRDLELAKKARDEAQAKLLEAMSEQKLKQWKTEQATISRCWRKTVSVDPMYKKLVEKRVKDGECVDGWDLKEKEYISIRPIKK